MRFKPTGKSDRKDSRSSDRGRDARRSGGFGSRGPRRDAKKEMHRAICDKCNKSCEVPFRPTAGKPIYCSECFKKENDGQRGNSSAALEEINKKLDKIIAALEMQ